MQMVIFCMAIDALKVARWKQAAIEYPFTPF